MKLRYIIESDITRRDFLKKTGATMASLSTIIQFLVDNGMAPEIAQGVASGTTPVSYIVSTGTGDASALASQFKKVDKAAKLTKSLGKFNGFGIDEDAFFTGKMHPNLFIKMQKAAIEETPIKVGDVEMQVVDNGDCLELFIHGGDNYAHIYKGDLPKYYSKTTMSVTGRDGNPEPIKTWWENYGIHGDDYLDQEAIEIMQELDLRFRDCDEEYMDELEFERKEQEESTQRWKPEPEASAMHQWFESKLQLTLNPSP